MSSVSAAERAAALAEKKRQLEALRARTTKGGASDTTAAGSAAAVVPVPAAPPVGPPPTMAPAALDALIEETVASSEAAVHAIRARRWAPHTGVASVSLRAGGPTTTYEASTQSDDALPTHAHQTRRAAASPADPSHHSRSGSLSDHDGHAADGDEATSAVSGSVATSEDALLATTRPEFVAFMSQAARAVERLLAAQAGVGTASVGLSDWREGVGTDGQPGDTRSASMGAAAEVVRWLHTATCAPLPLLGRAVVAVDWSPHLTDLVVAAYSPARSGGPLSPAPVPVDVTEAVRGYPQNRMLSNADAALPAAAAASPGLLCAWNLSAPQRPEAVCTCLSPVTALRALAGSAAAVAAGCADGQVCLWELRCVRA